MNKTISIIGGDSRQLFAAGYLIAKGFDVKIFACEHGRLPNKAVFAETLDEAFTSDIIILPLPVSKTVNQLNTPLSSMEIKIKDITDRITENHVIFYGMGNPSFTKQVRAKTNYSTDYFLIEGLIYKNAFLTAEGILSIMLEKIPTTLYGMKTAITGFGRIGTLTADKLIRLGADVTVFARNEMQLIKAELMGAKAYSLNDIPIHIRDYDCVINTIPYPVIDKDTINNSNPECVFIEAASAPYGIDGDACTKLGRTHIKAFSLPGKTAPKSAGIIIGETIYSELREVK